MATAIPDCLSNLGRVRVSLRGEHQPAGNVTRRRIYAEGRSVQNARNLRGCIVDFTRGGLRRMIEKSARHRHVQLGSLYLGNYLVGLISQNDQGRIPAIKSDTVPPPAASIWCRCCRLPPMLTATRTNPGSRGK